MNRRNFIKYKLRTALATFGDHPYGGIPSSGGITPHTEYHVGVARMAEALHCILGSIIRGMDQGKLHRGEIAHIEEEMRLIEKLQKEYSRSLYTDMLDPNSERGKNYPDLEGKVEDLRKESKDLFFKSEKGKRGLSSKTFPLSKNAFKLADSTYFLLNRLSLGAINATENWPEVKNVFSIMKNDVAGLRKLVNNLKKEEHYVS